MLRHIIILLISLFIVSCSSEDAPTEPNCTLEESPTPPAHKLSTNAHRLNIPLDQEKLVTFMWTRPDQAECFLKTNGNISLSKISSGGLKNEDFVSFKPAPDDIAASWSNYENQLGSPLMGLTTFRFYQTPDEPLIGTYITVKDVARPWHLWHEYSHALIGQARAIDPNLSLRIPSQKNIEDAYAKISQQPSNSSDYATSLQKLISDYQEHIQKLYIDEILIETVLVHFAINHQESLGVEDRDILQAQFTIDFFYQRYSMFLEQTINDLSNLKLKHASTKKHQLMFLMAEKNLNEQHKEVLKMVDFALEQITLVSHD